MMTSSRTVIASSQAVRVDDMSESVRAARTNTFNQIIIKAVGMRDEVCVQVC